MAVVRQLDQKLSCWPSLSFTACSLVAGLLRPLTRTACIVRYDCKAKSSDQSAAASSLAVAAASQFRIRHLYWKFSMLHLTLQVIPTNPQPQDLIFLFICFSLGYQIKDRRSLTGLTGWSGHILLLILVWISTLGTEKVSLSKIWP